MGGRVSSGVRVKQFTGTCTPCLLLVQADLSDFFSLFFLLNHRASTAVKYTGPRVPDYPKIRVGLLDYLN